MSSTNGFPFLSKRAIADMIRTDRAYALDTFRVLLARTEQHAAGLQGAGGFMASHRPAARQLAAVLEERPLNDAEHAKLVAILVHYSRQLAAHFRAVDLQARSELLSIASTFSAIPAMTSEPSTMVAAGHDEVTASMAESPAAVDAPAPRRRGRPPGSRSKKPRSEPEQPKRRRRRS